MARQPVVRHNDWGSLTPPALGDWTPTLSVTVVVPTFNYQHTLPYVCLFTHLTLPTILRV